MWSIIMCKRIISENGISNLKKSIDHVRFKFVSMKNSSILLVVLALYSFLGDEFVNVLDLLGHFSEHPREIPYIVESNSVREKHRPLELNHIMVQHLEQVTRKKHTIDD